MYTKTTPSYQDGYYVVLFYCLPFSYSIFVKKIHESSSKHSKPLIYGYRVKWLVDDHDVLELWGCTHVLWLITPLNLWALSEIFTVSHEILIPSFC